jgi:cytochrome c peroxidase
VSLGRLLFFDNVLALHEDNACAGCHSPAFGLGDSQTMAIGVQSNGIVGPLRSGPRNQRKAPPVVNAAMLPRLMLNGRITAVSGDPFDNSLGFAFPAPESHLRKFPSGDPRFPTLLSAQGLLPFTSLFEMAGFTGARTRPFFKDTPWLHAFDDGRGTRLPNDTNHTDFRDPGFLNEEIRDLILHRVQKISGYALGFADVFGGGRAAGFHVQDWMIGQALAEFQLSLVFTDAPIDRFARGDHGAMSDAQKRGALLFFGEAGCVRCHAVGGGAYEMFSDFQVRVLGVPQVLPSGFGPGLGNVVFDGPAHDEDFGAEQATGLPSDRYKFRTTPLRNMAVQRAFFHNGAFTRLADAVRHHLDVAGSIAAYHPAVAGLDPDLTVRRGPDVPLALVDPLVQQPLALGAAGRDDLLAFVRDGLLDPRARPDYLCHLVPRTVPSGFPVLVFQGC